MFFGHTLLLANELVNMFCYIRPAVSHIYRARHLLKYKGLAQTHSRFARSYDIGPWPPMKTCFNALHNRSSS